METEEAFLSLPFHPLRKRLSTQKMTMQEKKKCSKPASSKKIKMFCWWLM